MIGSDLDDFFQEIRQIEASTTDNIYLDCTDGHDKSDSDDEHSPTPTEHQLEIKWLEDVGLGLLVNDYKAGQEIELKTLKISTGPLTRRQREAVVKRVAPLNSTLRKKRLNSVHEIYHKMEKPPDILSDLIRPKSSSSLLHKLKRKLLRSQTKSYNIDMVGNVSLNNNSSKNPPNSVVSIKGLRHISSSIPSLPLACAGDGNTVLTNPISTTRASSGIDLSSCVSLDLDDEQELNEPYQIAEHLAKQLNCVADGEDSSVEQLELDSDPAELDTSTCLDPALPRIELPWDDTGLTHITHLTESDLDQLRHVVFIELTSLLDSYNIPHPNLKRRRTHSYSDCIFGNSLGHLLQTDRAANADAKIPVVLKQLLEHCQNFGLTEPGFLRISGQTSRIEALRKSIDSKYSQGNNDFLSSCCLNEYSVHDISSLLKKFIRELRPPLLTREFMDTFSKSQTISEMRDQLAVLNLLILLLPNAHRSSLKAILEFLHHVVQYENINRMSLSNVSMVMAPNIFPMGSSKQKNKVLNRRSTSKFKYADDEMQYAMRSSKLLRVLINYQDLLWLIPPHLVRQLRQLNISQSKQKAVSSLRQVTKRVQRTKSDSLLMFVDRGNSGNATRETNTIPVPVVRIQAPDLSKRTMALELKPELLSKDVIDKFTVNRTASNASFDQSTEGGVSSRISAVKELAVYEIGGNITERKLHPNASMLSVHKSNPWGQFIVK